MKKFGFDDRVRMVHAIYGLNDAGKRFFERVERYLTVELELIQCVYDPCVFYNHDCTVISVHVDDLLYTCSNEFFETKMAKLFEHFGIKSVGVATDHGGIYHCGVHYLNNLWYFHLVVASSEVLRTATYFRMTVICVIALKWRV